MSKAMQHVPLSSSDQRMENTTCSCCARNEKGESDYSVSWKRVSTIIWVDTCLEDKVRHRRPPQIARYTVTYRSPAEPRINASTSGHRHQNIQRLLRRFRDEYAVSRKGDGLGHATYRSQRSQHSSPRTGAVSQLKRLAKIQCPPKRKKKKIKVGSHGEVIISI